MDLAPIIAKKAERFRELDNAIADPALFDQPTRARATLREHTQLKGLLDSWATRQKARTQLDENVEMTKGETDAEIARHGGGGNGRAGKRIGPAGPRNPTASPAAGPERGPRRHRGNPRGHRRQRGGAFRRGPAPDVHALRRRLGLENRADGFQSFGAGRIEGSGVPGVGRIRVPAAALRERRASGPARSGDGSAGAHPHQHGDGGRAAGSGGGGTRIETR